LVQLVDGESGGEAAAMDWRAFVESYAGVTRVTNAAHRVNGRSVLDKLDAFGGQPRPWWDTRRWLSVLVSPRCCQRPVTLAICWGRSDSGSRSSWAKLRGSAIRTR